MKESLMLFGNPSGIVRSVHLALFVAMLLVTPMLMSCSRPGTVNEHWIWQYVSRPKGSGDGFLELHAAVREYQMKGGATSTVLIKVSNAAQAREWSGRPDFQRAFPGSDHASASQLVSSDGRTAIQYKELISLSKALSAHLALMIENGDAQQATALSKTMIRLGYQISRGKEEQVIGTLRLALWETGFDGLSDTGAITSTEKSEAMARLATELRTIRERDSDALYGLRRD